MNEGVVFETPDLAWCGQPMGVSASAAQASAVVLLREKFLRKSKKKMCLEVARNDWMSCQASPHQ